MSRLYRSTGASSACIGYVRSECVRMLLVGAPDASSGVTPGPTEREHGWSLFGLWQSVNAQGRVDDARQVRRRFDKAWARAAAGASVMARAATAVIRNRAANERTKVGVHERTNMVSSPVKTNE